MRRFADLFRDKSGISAAEFALLAPTFIAMIIGIGQFGILFQAQAGLRHTVQEGARYATTWVPNGPGTPQRPTDAQIIAQMATSRYGLDPAYITGPTITCHYEVAGAPPVLCPAPSGSTTYLDITMSYAVPLNFVFYRPPPVTLTETRRVYVQS